MKVEICVIQYTHKDGRKGHLLEIDGNISLRLSHADAEEIIKLKKMKVQEEFDHLSEPEGKKTELFY